MNQIENAVNVLKNGGIVIFPTDTVFGIGCRIDRPESVDRLFLLRKRPLTQATPVLVSSIAMALTYLDSPSDIVRRLMEKYWPGALTIIAPCKIDVVHSPIRGGGNTIGLRMPNHPELLNLIERVGVPILGPSANFHGQKTPTAQSELNPELVKLVDCVMPGECLAERDLASPDTRKQASTVVDASVTPIKIIRQGAVTLDPKFMQL